MGLWRRGFVLLASGRGFDPHEPVKGWGRIFYTCTCEPMRMLLCLIASLVCVSSREKDSFLREGIFCYERTTSEGTSIIIAFLSLYYFPLAGIVLNVIHPGLDSEIARGVPFYQKRGPGSASVVSLQVSGCYLLLVHRGPCNITDGKCAAWLFLRRLLAGFNDRGVCSPGPGVWQVNMKRDLFNKISGGVRAVNPLQAYAVQLKIR